MLIPDDCISYYLRDRLIPMNIARIISVSSVEEDTKMELQDCLDRYTTANAKLKKILSELKERK